MMILLAILLGLSLAGNAVLFYYTRYLVKDIRFIAENISEVIGISEKFRDHVQALLDKPIFHEDPYLKRLVQHTLEYTTDLSDFIEEFKEVKILKDEKEEKSGSSDSDER